MGLLAGIGSRRVLCFDWDTHNLRVVQAAVGKGGIRILGATEVPVPAIVEVGQAASFGAFLRSTLRTLGLRADHVIMCIPRQDAVLNPLTLPPTADSELANMVRFQIAKELPFSLDQAVVDFAIVPKGETDVVGVELLVAAVRNHILDYFKAVAQEAGLKIDRVGLRPHANMVTITREPAYCKGRVVLVDVGPQMTEIDVIRDGRLVFSRAAAVTVHAATGEADEKAPGSPHKHDDAVIPFRDARETSASAVEELLVEVTRTLAAYRASDPAAAIDRVIVAGSSGIEEELSQAFAKRFETPTSIYRPPDDLTRELEHQATVSWNSFGAALGLAWGNMYSGTAHFDFLHPKKPLDAHKERMRKVPVVASAAAAVLLLVSTAVGLKWHAKAVEIRTLDTKLKASKDELAEIDDFNSRVMAADHWRRRNVVWLDEIRAIADALPQSKDVYLRELSTTDDDEVVLKMVATDGSAVAKLLERLNGLKTEKGKARFVVTPGARVTNKDPKYKVQTDIRLQIKAMLPEPTSQKAGKRSGR